MNLIWLIIQELVGYQKIKGKYLYPMKYHLLAPFMFKFKFRLNTFQTKKSEFDNIVISIGN